MSLCYRPAMGRWLRWRDGLAVAIALGALVAGVALWLDGRVSFGLQLTEMDPAEARHMGIAGLGTLVVVSEVVPDGNAVRYGIFDGMVVADLRTTDGSEVVRSDVPVEDAYGGGTVRLPIQGVESARLEALTVGHVWGASPTQLVVEAGWQMERDWLESRLRSDVYLIAIGLAFGLAVWLLLRLGLAGWIGRQEALTVAAVVATPYLLIPLIEVGNPIGIAATYAAAIGAALLLGIGLASTHPEERYRQIGAGAMLAAAVTAGFLVWRHMTTPLLSPDERGPMLVAIGAVAFAPAAVASLSPERSLFDRLTLLTTGLVPAAAVSMFLPTAITPILPVILVAGLLGWHVLPWSRVASLLGAEFDRVRSGATSAAENPLAAAVIQRRRDLLTLGVLAVTALVSATQEAAWALVIALAAGGAIALAARRDVLGANWTDAAVPLGAAVAIPILVVPLTWGSWAGLYPPLLLPAALGALSVAHLLAERHTDPVWRRRLFAIAALVALVAILTGSGDDWFAIALLAVVPLVPAIPVAFTDRPDAQAISWRLETLAVAATPGVAATVLLPGGSGVLLLGGWLVVMIVWRYVAILPLVGLANRTQLQRDLAVAAAETERARLAADLHDDALQQLTMLVRTLDESGQKAAADEAREVATKLRSVVGDLRLPILDDLGAGAALEWLVERVEPLAGGPVKLERSDEARPPANVELAVFRVAQEALTNAIKHGRAPIAVRYDVRSDGRVTLAVDDAGPGIGPEAADEAPRQGHFGLANMQQRAEQIGALLDVRRWPAGGTRVALEWRPQ